MPDGFDKSEPTKQNKALLLLKGNSFISSQVIIKTYLVCSRKLKLPVAICDKNTQILCDITTLIPTEPTTFAIGIRIKDNYQFSFLDSMIIASAIQSGSTVLYSEDMHTDNY